MIRRIYEMMRRKRKNIERIKEDKLEIRPANKGEITGQNFWEQLEESIQPVKVRNFWEELEENV